MGPPTSCVSLCLVLFLVQINGRVAQNLSTSKWDQVYDYIVVGAGSAGAVLANRLSEEPHVRVLLLEAGGHETALSEIPLLAGYLQKTKLDWSYETVPQEHCCSALKERRMTCARGKVLGGSSVLNYMLYVRGNRRDYDGWARDEGAKGWSWREVLPYFLRAEDMSDERFLAGSYHSRGGPLTVSYVDSSTVRPASLAFLQAGKHLGYPIGDYNGATQAVFALPQTTIREGRRCSTSKAYLQPARERKNLHIVTHAHVTKILFKSSEPEPAAYGVEFFRFKQASQVFARREIISAAGALNSPKLLMLSGIGPAEQLKALDIPLLADLPVGENLQDHVYPDLVYTVSKGSSPAVTQSMVFKNLLDFLSLHKGPFAQGGGVEAFGFIKTRLMNQTDDFPDFQIHLLPDSLADLLLPMKRTQQVTEEFYQQVFAPHQAADQISLLTTILRPKSRGFVRLAGITLR